MILLLEEDDVDEDGDKRDYNSADPAGKVRHSPFLLVARSEPSEGCKGSDQTDTDSPDPELSPGRHSSTPRLFQLQSRKPPLDVGNDGRVSLRRHLNQDRGHDKLDLLDKTELQLTQGSGQFVLADRDTSITARFSQQIPLAYR